MAAGKAAGVYSSEIDLSQVIQSNAITIGGIVFASKQGPLGIQDITAQSIWDSTYGTPDSSVSMAHYVARDYLGVSSNLRACRVAGTGYAYAGSLLQYDSTGGTYSLVGYGIGDPTLIDFSTAGGAGGNVTNLAYIYSIGPGVFYNGYKLDIKSNNIVAPANGAVTNLTTGGSLPAATYNYVVTAVGKLGETLPTSVISVTQASGTTNSNKLTWTAVPNAAGYRVYGRSTAPYGLIASVSSSYYSTNTVGSVSIVNGGSGYSAATVAFSGGSGSGAAGTVTINGSVQNTITVTAGGTGYTTAPTVTFSAPQLPNGTAATGTATVTTGAVTGVTVTSAGSGYTSPPTISFGGPGTGATATCTIAGPVQSVTISNGGTGYVTSPTVTISGDGTGATATAVLTQVNQVSFLDTGALTPNSSVNPPSVAFTQATDFTLDVYDTSQSTTVPVDTYDVSLGYQLDGYGQQTEIATRLANSKYIHAINNAIVLSSNPSYTLPYIASTSMSGGADGATVVDADIVAGWAQFLNRDQVQVSILMDGGYSSPTVQAYMDSVCQSRKDCISILSVPSTDQQSQDAITYRQVTLNLNSNRSMLVTPDVQELDPNSKLPIYVPPSGVVAGRLAFTDFVTNPGYSPAGFQRGIIPGVTGTRYIYDRGEWDNLAAAQVSYLRNTSGQGVTLWEQLSLQSASSALSYMSVRRIFDVIENSVRDALEYILQQPNDAFTQKQVVNMITAFMENLKRAQVISAYDVVCDSNNNTNYTLGQALLNVNVYATPTLPINRIQLQTIITPQGANFNELIAQTGA